MITCPVCGMTSHNPRDEVEGYCGNCHDWTSPPGKAPAQVKDFDLAERAAYFGVPEEDLRAFIEGGQ